MSSQVTVCPGHSTPGAVLAPSLGQEGQATHPVHCRAGAAEITEAGIGNFA